MKTSTPQSPKTPEPLSILLIGPPGGGKTTLAMQFPSVEFMDCDRNLDGPERFIRKNLASLSYGYNSITMDDDNKPVPAELCYDRLIDKLDLAKTTPSKTVVIDSLTLVNEFIIRKILHDQRRSSGEMEARDWIPFKTRMINLLVAKVRNLGKTTICTVHETILTKPDPKNIMNREIVGYQPSVQGSIVDFFGGFFTDMWRCTAHAAPADRVEYKIHTCRTALSDLKNSIGLPNEILVRQGELAFDKIKPFLNGKL